MIQPAPVLDRRVLLLGAGCLAMLPARLPGATAGPAPGPADAHLAAVLVALGRIDPADPMDATWRGLDGGAGAALKHQLNGCTRADENRRTTVVAARLESVVAVDRRALSEQGRLSFDIAHRQLSAELAMRRSLDVGLTVLDRMPYAINPFSSTFNVVPTLLANGHGIATADDAEAWLDRMRAFPKALDDTAQIARDDAGRGGCPADFLLDATIEQLVRQRDETAARSVLVTTLAARLKTAGLPDTAVATATRILDSEIQPALDRHLATARGLRARATADAGVWKLPGGEAYYAAQLADQTSGDMAPDAVHALGLDQVARISARLDGELRRQGYTSGTVGERISALRVSPAQLYPDSDLGREALLDELRREIAGAYAALPHWFDAVPRTPIIVERVPPAAEAGSSGGGLIPAPADLSRPAYYTINLHDMQANPRFGLPTLTYHETVPGHHLQSLVVNASTGLPKYRRDVGFAGYSEGWALYAEQLADEMGLYDRNPIGRIGMLQARLMRATRLVIDSGLHAKRWSRDQAVRYFVETNSDTPSSATREVNRYASLPGQACAYMIGAMAWDAARRRMESAQGRAFDIRRFHAILREGPVPVAMLDGLVDDAMRKNA